MEHFDTAVVDSLKVLDPNRPIREADIAAGQTRDRKHLSECFKSFEDPRASVHRQC